MEERKRETRISLVIKPGSPALHHGGIQTTAQPNALTQTFLFSVFYFHFCEVELGKLYVGDVILL